MICSTLHQALLVKMLLVAGVGAQLDQSIIRCQKERRHFYPESQGFHQASAQRYAGYR